MFFETTPEGVRIVCTDANCSAMIVDDNGIRAKAIAELNALENPLKWWVARVLVSDPADRGKGLGSLVLQAALKAVLVPTSGMAHVIVAPGGYENGHERQRRFYKKNGFCMVDDRGLMGWRCSPESH